MIDALKLRTFVAAIALSGGLAANAATITVTNALDTTTTGDGVSLREAILSINAGANTNADVVATNLPYGTNDTINFGLSSGFHLINIGVPSPGSLPTITKPVTIDGSTQPGSVVNTAVTGDNSTHNIMINCSSVNSCTNGLTLGQGSAGSTIRFLIFDAAPGAGLVVNSANNTIAGNWIGLDSAGGGTAGSENATGLSVFSAGLGTDISNNIIGGPNPQDRNVIGHNTNQQVAISRLLSGGNYGGGSNILVENNYIGTNAAGTVGLLSGSGIRLTSLLNATIGGASFTPGGSCSGLCNLIAGNSLAPLTINTNTNGTDNTGYVIEGNFFGTNLTGTAAITGGNGAGTQPVIEVTGAGTVTIGGTAAGTGNLISGFSTARNGIQVDAGNAGLVTIQGNYIGTTTTGNAALGNGGSGIDIRSTSVLIIGGTTAAARNVICANGTVANPTFGAGIRLEGANLVIIQGNNIGVGADGSTAIGNIGHGIEAMSNSTGNLIGPNTSGGAGGNIIANNGSGLLHGAGVAMDAGNTGNEIFSNSIFANTGTSTGLGIDLGASNTGADGPTANDHCDGDSGGNTLQNFPVLTSALTTGSSITIAGTLDSTASTTFTIEFFSNASGSQGQTFLGSTTTTTNGSCAASFSASLAQAVAAGLNITATATDPSGNTSEFSAAVVSTVAPTTVTKAFSPTTIAVNGTSTMTVTLTNPSASAFTGATISDTYPVGLVNATPASAGTTCGGTLTAANGANSFSLTGGTIPAGGSCTITVNVTSSSAGSYVNTTGNVTGSGTPSSSGGTATLTVQSSPTVSKAFSPNFIPINGTSTLTITLGNTNSGGITGVSFTDTYPSGLVNAAAASTSCTGGTLTGSAGAGSVSLTGTTIPAGGCTVTVNVTSNTAGSYPNSIGAGTVTSSFAGSNAAGTSDVLFVLSPPGGTKSFAPPSIAPGGTSVLTISLTNSNSSSITSVAFTDTYPLNVVNAATPSASTTCGGTLTANAGAGSITLGGGAAIPAGGCNVTVTVTSNTVGTYNNSIPAGGVTSSNAGSNTAPIAATLSVSTLTAPTVSKTFNPNPISAGTSSTLTITLTNSNGTAITGVTFTDTYPSGLINASPANPATTCGGTATGAIGGNSVALSGGTIPANGSCTVTVLVTAASVGSYVDTIPAGGVTSSNAPASSSPATATLTVAAAIPAMTPWTLFLLFLVLGGVGVIVMKGS